MKFGDMAVAILIVSIVLIMIIPIPAGVLDVLIAFNIAIALVILLNVIYSKEALQMSIFPSLLLFTTIYRLSLNIKSTTLVLASGEAGKVIEGFGKFVAQDNLVVGFIVFLIITIVQFLVITKGTERVSEVAARFTLDAMPGKQMAIDADLNAGLINEAEARERRKKVQREADFYGAMDGATKYVKGDAIAGIVITILNVVGGLIIGMIMRGEDITFALQNYSILTIGDGLVSQIPSLLISFATGLIVTRSTSDNGLSDDLKKQILYNPKVFFIAAGFCALLAFPLATIPFMSLAAVFMILGIKLTKKEQKDQKQEETQIEEKEVEEIRKPENVVNLLQVDPIELEFGYGIIPLADVNQGGDLLDRVVMIRRQLALELGMIVPIIRLRDNIQLSPNEYVIKIKGVEVASGEIMLDHFIAMSPGFVEEEIEGIKTTEPAFGLPAVWINEAQRDKAEMLGYTVVDPPSIIATHLTEIVKAHAHELTGRQEVQTIIEKVKENYPAIVDELVPKVMTIGEIQKVVANLLKEGVSIRDIVTILETLADYAPVTHDTDMLTEYVRQALGRAISKKFIRDKKSNVITLDPKLEQIILDAVQRTEHGSYLTLEPNTTNSIISNLSNQVQRLMKLGQQPIVLASPIVRLYFRRLTEQAIPGLVVLSYNELDPHLEVQSVGMVSI
ncbi:flagellar biosynthesis protein FlhA [Acetivibrio cellulolyticus]|uniref:flagellar biosynthesis protein FlhA n=1 Tax=Acetivibrio cellulolyticus TaxID=35830 RepID=UPI0001E2C23B|nr:flagellar biosynthesis protein FlhA [Acetivibrio cellulolyticus]